MTDDQLRQLVRESLARHLGRSALESRGVVPSWKTHASHERFILPVGSDTDGPCLVEPAVGCVHCGFCQSWGH